MSQLHCIVVTPERTALDEVTDFVALPLYDGEYGVAPGHSPVIARLGYGELRLKSGGATEERYYIDGGFVQVADNVVSILTERAIPAEKLDAGAAHEDLNAALTRPANTPERMETRDREIARARAQIRIASHVR
ncbi:MAG: ATP synthase F1 subunit epsilon [Planctomycetes bacterium]|nr:ATP synthase F1 subunit epsilon [Planctomycetota bacterium]